MRTLLFVALLLVIRHSLLAEQLTFSLNTNAIHLRKDEKDEKVPKIHELYVDVGASNAADVAKLGLRVGIPGVYADGAEEFGNGRIVGRALDNRVGGFIIAQVLARLAKQADMSVFHFNRLFKRATGLPPSQYHIRLRLDTARRLLRETDRSVIEVANEVGYSNPSHFAQLFRKDPGLSPSDYRRER